VKDLDNFDEVGIWVSTCPCGLMVSGASLHLCECPMKVISTDWDNRAFFTMSAATRKYDKIRSGISWLKMDIAMNFFFQSNPSDLILRI